MNHAGEITPLTGMVRPHVAVVTTVGPVHTENLRQRRGRRRRQGRDLRRPGAGRRRGAQPRQPLVRALLGQRRSVARRRVVTFGEHAEADVRARPGWSLKPDRRWSRPGASASAVTYRFCSPGRHWRMNSLAVLPCSRRSAATSTLRLPSPWPMLSRRRAAAQQIRLAAPGGAFTLIDESYNANPASMRAALEVLGQSPLGCAAAGSRCWATCWNWARTRRSCHAGLAAALREQRDRPASLPPGR